MANNKLTLNVEEPTPKKSAKPETKKSSKAKRDPNKPSIWQRFLKVCREMKSELKKVEWPSIKKSKNNPGVLVNLGTVIVVVLFFLVIITLFDLGLAKLLELLTQVGQ